MSGPNQGCVSMGAVKAVDPKAVKVALEAAGQAMFEYDAETGVVEWADREGATALLDVPASEIDAIPNLLSLMEPEDLVNRETAIKQSKANGTSYVVEYALTSKQGLKRWFEERGSWLKLPRGERLIGVIRTIDEQKSKEAALSWQATYDELTGHLNRARLREVLRDRLEMCKAGGVETSYLLVGIDNLGAINTDFGFDVADEVIVELSKRLKSVLNEKDSIGRVAGTKFGIVLAESCPEEVRTVCNALMGAVRASVIDTHMGGVSASVCIGATRLDRNTISSDLAMAQAEAALDAAKRIGPSSWSSFSEKTETVSLRKRNTELSDVILTALNERRVCLAYQPIVSDLNDPQRKFECLIRMKHEDGHEVPAPEFIPAAERLGLVHLLDRRVLELATYALTKNPDIALNVNISWETVKDPVWAEGYLAHLRANRAVADRITVELTETQVVDAIEASVEFVQEIKEIGCHFAIDDFGAGYTSFRNLKALDIDVLKIDGSFVTGVSSSRENQLFVRTLLDLARNFGMKTVAEWVDNDADAMLLKGLGVDYLQGFYIGKPEQRPEWSMDLPQAPTGAVKTAFAK